MKIDIQKKTLLNYIDSYRADSAGILQKNVEHAEIDNKVSNRVKLAKIALEVGFLHCESLPLVGSIFKVIDGAIDYCYSEYKQKKFEDKVNLINKIIMYNHSANTQEDSSQIIKKAAIEIAQKKHEAKAFTQLQFELENPKLPGSIYKITGFINAKINQIGEYGLCKQIQLQDSVGGGEALKDVIMCLAHLQKNFEDDIKNLKPFYQMFRLNKLQLIKYKHSQQIWNKYQHLQSQLKKMIGRQLNKVHSKLNSFKKKWLQRKNNQKMLRRNIFKNLQNNKIYNKNNLLLKKRNNSSKHNKIILKCNRNKKIFKFKSQINQLNLIIKINKRINKLNNLEIVIVASSNDNVKLI